MENHPGDTLGTRFLTFWGAIGAFFAFAVFAILLQQCTSQSGPADPRDSVRLANTAEAEDAGGEQLKTMGWENPSEDTINEAISLLNERKPKASTMVAPGTETAAKMAAEAAAASSEKEGEGASTESETDSPEAETEDEGTNTEPETDSPEASDPAGSAESPDAPEANPTTEPDPA